MLYDNAQLIRAYLHAYQLTGQPFYRRVAEESLAFVSRELSNPQGGFYASLDADSEGREGKFYLWTQAEIQAALGESWEFFKTAYKITAAGNWEGETVLQRAVEDAALSTLFKLPEAEVAVKLADCHARLLAIRAARQRPGTDDKIITVWNGLMLSAFAEAARVLDPAYLKTATHSANFLLTALRPGGKLCRAWRNGKTSGQAFLEDYAALALGLLDLYQVAFDVRSCALAQELIDEMVARFSDPLGGFFDTPLDGETLLVRPKDLQDNATPSGNALAVEALLKLAALTGRADYRSLAEQALRLVVEPALRYPTAFARWLTAADFALARVKQVAIVGKPESPAAQEMLQVVRESYRPHLVLAVSNLPLDSQSPPLLRDRPILDGQPTAYLCENFVCKLPVTTAQELKSLL